MNPTNQLSQLEQLKPFTTLAIRAFCADTVKLEQLMEAAR
jgi:exo-beta-1,3-glucanase (GH17 family)